MSRRLSLPSRPLALPALGSVQAGARLGALERFAPVLLLAFAVSFNLYYLYPTVLVQSPFANDGALHFLALQAVVAALANGQDPTDTWLAPIGMGYPLFHHYQHLAYLPPALIYRLFGGALPLLDLYNWTSYLLLSLFPLSIAWSARRFGFSRLQAALTGLVAPLPSTDGLFGF